MPRSRRRGVVVVNGPMVIALTVGDVLMIAAGLSFQHAVLGCQDCQGRTLELLHEWAAPEGAEREAARAHVDDLSRRLVAGAHGFGWAS